MTEMQRLSESFARLRLIASESPRKPPVSGCDHGASPWIITKAGAVRCERCRPPTNTILARAGIPKEKIPASLTANLHEQNIERAAQLQALLDSKLEKPGSPPWSLWFTGPHGRGKSWLAAACLRYVVDVHRWSIGWVTIRDLIREIHGVYQRANAEGGDTVQEIIDRLRVPRLLVLNELPRDRVTTHVREVLEGVIDWRIDEEGRPIILTGNVPPRDLPELYSPAIASRLGDRMVLRIPFSGGVDLRQGGAV